MTQRVLLVGPGVPWNCEQVPNHLPDSLQVPVGLEGGWAAAGKVSKARTGKVRASLSPAPPRELCFDTQ